MGSSRRSPWLLASALFLASQLPHQAGATWRADVQRTANGFKGNRSASGALGALEAAIPTDAEVAVDEPTELIEAGLWTSENPSARKTVSDDQACAKSSSMVWAVALGMVSIVFGFSIRGSEANKRVSSIASYMYFVGMMHCTIVIPDSIGICQKYGYPINEAGVFVAMYTLGAGGTSLFAYVTPLSFRHKNASFWLILSTLVTTAGTVLYALGLKWMSWDFLIIGRFIQGCGFGFVSFIANLVRLLNEPIATRVRGASRFVIIGASAFGVGLVANALGRTMGDDCGPTFVPACSMMFVSSVCALLILMVFIPKRSDVDESNLHNRDTHIKRRAGNNDDEDEFHSEQDGDSEETDWEYLDARVRRFACVRNTAVIGAALSSASAAFVIMGCITGGAFLLQNAHSWDSTDVGFACAVPLVVLVPFYLLKACCGVHHNQLKALRRQKIFIRCMLFFCVGATVFLLKPVEDLIGALSEAQLLLIAMGALVPSMLIVSGTLKGVSEIAVLPDHQGMDAEATVMLTGVATNLFSRSLAAYLAVVIADASMELGSTILTIVIIFYILMTLVLFEVFVVHKRTVAMSCVCFTFIPTCTQLCYGYEMSGRFEANEEYVSGNFGAAGLLVGEEEEGDSLQESEVQSAREGDSLQESAVDSY